MNTDAGYLTPDTEIARCVFVEADIQDAWCELVDDPDAEAPPEVLRAMRSQVGLISEAMCQRGQEVIDELLRALTQGSASGDHAALPPADSHPQGGQSVEVASPYD